jgi:opacity protein-like surface antigen
VAVNRTAHLALLAAAAVLLAAPAFAAAKPRRGGEMLSVWAVLDPGPVSGVGVGGRVMLPLVPQGLLHHPRIKDELTLELGADFVHFEDRVGYAPTYVDYSWNGFLPVVGATWNFWLTPELALYPKVDLGYWFGWYSGWNEYYGYGHAGFGGAFLQGALGVVYRLQTVALRVELGSGLLRIGAGFPF